MANSLGRRCAWKAYRPGNRLWIETTVFRMDKDEGYAMSMIVDIDGEAATVLYNLLECRDGPVADVYIPSLRLALVEDDDVSEESIARVAARAIRCLREYNAVVATEALSRGYGVGADGVLFSGDTGVAPERFPSQKRYEVWGASENDEGKPYLSHGHCAQSDEWFLFVWIDGCYRAIERS